MSEMNDEEIPKLLKWTFITINRIGFPIVAFLLMWWMCQGAIEKVNAAIQANTIVLQEVRDTLIRIDNHHR